MQLEALGNGAEPVRTSKIANLQEETVLSICTKTQLSDQFGFTSKPLALSIKILWLGLFGLCSITVAQQDTTKAIPADSLLIQQLQQQMATIPQQAAPAAAPRATLSTNPNMSVIGDFRATYFSPARRHLETEFHEAEFAFQSVVDPYARADFYLSLAPDPETGEFAIELEEGYLTTQTLPAGLQLKVGKFRSAFGKINVIHPHALPYIDVTSVYNNYFGEEGLNDTGLSLSWLVPNPLDFYQELTVEATRGPAENISFAASEFDRFLYLAHLKNFWDLTPNATLELGLSGSVGPSPAGFNAAIGGVDVTYKWKPLRLNTYQSVVLQTEVLWSHAKIAAREKIKSWGMYTLATYQLQKRWFLTGRFDYSNRPYNASFVERAFSGTLGWLATEFQKAEIEFKMTSSNAEERTTQVLLRSVFVIGAHGAHAY
ncbi:MAG: hypothetical protein ALAOOOJD_00702 [bacterium]|nr:hypothetical protein [bacterium]